MEHQEFSPRAFVRFHGRRRRGLPKGVFHAKMRIAGYRPDCALNNLGNPGNFPGKTGNALRKLFVGLLPGGAPMRFDGHVRLYHGQQTELPRRYVARQKLCLRGTTDYWVNDALGQPSSSK